MFSSELKDFFVDDIVSQSSEIIFVLESPHTQEVKNGYPVAGKSGVDMSKVLFGLNEPFGKLLFDGKIPKMGIVNVSNYPLQNVVYGSLHVDGMEFFQRVRQNPKFRKKDCELNNFLKIMLDDFKIRLQKYKTKKIVLCGNFVVSAFEEVFKEEDFALVYKVPHPSFNNWQKQKYKKEIDGLKELIEY